MASAMAPNATGMRQTARINLVFRWIRRFGIARAFARSSVCRSGICPVQRLNASLKMLASGPKPECVCGVPAGAVHPAQGSCVHRLPGDGTWRSQRDRDSPDRRPVTRNATRQIPAPCHADLRLPERCPQGAHSGRHSPQFSQAMRSIAFMPAIPPSTMKTNVTSEPIANVENPVSA